MSLKDTWYDLAFRGVVFVRCLYMVSSVFSPSTSSLWLLISEDEIEKA